MLPSPFAINLKFALYRDFPDPNRVDWEEKFSR